MDHGDGTGTEQVRLAFTTRREFLRATMVLGAGTLASCRVGLPEPTPPTQEEIDAVTVRARPGGATQVTEPGLYPLGLGVRDAILRVPSSYRHGSLAPLLILLHGANGAGADWMNRTDLREQADRAGAVLLAPSSAFTTWRNDVADVQAIDRALAETFRRCTIDPARITLGGFSDGGSAALTIGTPNGDLFRRIVAFSPGYQAARIRRADPAYFISAGTGDTIIRYDTTAGIVQTLRGLGSTVRFVTFDGGHVVPPSVMATAFDWLATPP